MGVPNPAGSSVNGDGGRRDARMAHSHYLSCYIVFGVVVVIAVVGVVTHCPYSPFGSNSPIPNNPKRKQQVTVICDDEGDDDADERAAAYCD